MPRPDEILDTAFQRISKGLKRPIVTDPQIVASVEYISRNLKNRAGVRLLMACLLAKVHKPHVDIRKPYTEIGGADSFSGRTYDEKYLTAFINQHNLPCNNTTAFLTPALRNRNETLTKDVEIIGRPRKLYDDVLARLDDVYNNHVSAEDLLAEVIRGLLIFRDEREQRMQSLITGLKTTEDAIPLSSEDIINLIEKHLSLKGTSRLPVLLVASAYQTAQDRLGEKVLSLHGHNSADIQTGALGDVEITLLDDDSVVTSYEMKDKRVLKEDIDRALQKLQATAKRVDNYIFITTDETAEEVQEYARSLYEETGGIEFVILDCIGFIRHFLHLFHRLRTDFLEAYQVLMLAEPQSSVSQPVKEAFLSMRQASEAD